VIGLFANSLAHRGFLGLGAKETLRFSAHAGEFSDFDRAERLYQKRGDR
jgi:chemotaxis protein methyltransferase CheR